MAVARMLRGAAEVGATMTSDRMIHQAVLEALSYEPGLNATDIGIAVHDGVVTLTGSVPSYFAKSVAERVVKRVGGVRGLAEELRVLPAKHHERTDTDIARAAVRALTWNVYVPAELIRVTVEEGWLTLEGEVGSFAQRSHAERAVQSLIGLRGVTNFIEVRPHLPPQNAERQIREAFDRHAGLDASHVRVAVNGSAVTLSGIVSTISERDMAAELAGAAPGVTSVLNDITVNPMRVRAGSIGIA
jgi:osmotically-inducible protein OsmY